MAIGSAGISRRGRVATFMPLAGLVGLSLVWAIQALIPDLIPNLQPERGRSLAEHSCSLAIATAVAGLYACLERSSWPRAIEAASCAAIGCALIVFPELLVRWSVSGASAYARTLMFSLVPLFAVVMEPHLSADSSAPLRGGLIASLACTAGALFVFPVDPPSTIFSSFAFAGLLLAATLIAAMSCLAHAHLVEAHGLHSSESSIVRTRSAKTAIVAGGAAFGFLSAHLITRWWNNTAASESSGLSFGLLARAVLESVGWLLLLWLLPRLRPSRAATRYILAPFLTVALGVLLLRLGGQGQAMLQIRTLAGLFLMGLGAVYLVLAPQATSDKSQILGLR